MKRIFQKLPTNQEQNKPSIASVLDQQKKKRERERRKEKGIAKKTHNLHSIFLILEFCAYVINI